MPSAETLKIYEAQVENLRALESSLKLLKKSVNDYLRQNKSAEASALTKVSALTLCSWSEGLFSKTIHTPHGFEDIEISQIKEKSRQGVANGWKYAIHLGAQHLEDIECNFSEDRKMKMENLVEKFVFEPSLLRNKLAHGQWVRALNREHTEVNEELTDLIENLNIVEITKWHDSQKLLGTMIEDLIESPNRKFVGDWDQYLTQIEERLSRNREKTIEEHIKRLVMKKRKYPRSN